MDLLNDRTTLLKGEHIYENYNATWSKWQTSIYDSYVDHLMDNLLKDITPRMSNASSPANTTSFGGRSEAMLSRGDRLLFVGIDFKKEEASGRRFRTMLMEPMAGKTFVDNNWQDGAIAKMGVFGEVHGNLAGIDCILSVRVDGCMDCAVVAKRQSAGTVHI